MRRFSFNYVRSFDELQESTQRTDRSDIVALIQDHHAACINIAAAPSRSGSMGASKSLDPLNALWVIFASLPSWSVSYRGVPYHDARLIDGVWWYNPIVGDSILRFPMQDHVTPLFENPPLKAYRRAC
jgi:hypothetical protein